MSFWRRNRFRLKDAFGMAALGVAAVLSLPDNPVALAATLLFTFNSCAQEIRKWCELSEDNDAALPLADDDPLSRRVAALAARAGVPPPKIITKFHDSAYYPQASMCPDGNIRINRVTESIVRNHPDVADGMFGHELWHHRQGDCMKKSILECAKPYFLSALWSTVATVIFSEHPDVSPLDILVPAVLSRSFVFDSLSCCLRRQQEFECDRGAATLSPEAGAGLARFFDYVRRRYPELDEKSLFMDHPVPSDRITALDSIPSPHPVSVRSA